MQQPTKSIWESTSVAAARREFQPRQANYDTIAGWGIWCWRLEETTALADWRHRIGLCGLEEEAERIGRKMAALGLRGDGTRDETRRGGGGAPKGVGHEKVSR